MTSSSGEVSLFELDPPTYTYTELLDRVVEILNANNPELAEKKRNTIKPPQLMRVGTKKTLWVNFQEICKMLHRNSEHVYQYMLAELGTEGSIDAQQRLVIKGKFIPKVSYPHVKILFSQCTAVHRNTSAKVYHRICDVFDVSLF